MTLPECFISVECHKPAISLSRFAKSSRIQVVLVPNNIIGSCFLKCKHKHKANHIFILTIIDIPVQPWAVYGHPAYGYGQPSTIHTTDMVIIAAKLWPVQWRDLSYGYRIYTLLLWIANNKSTWFCSRLIFVYPGNNVGVFLEYIFKWHRVRWHLNGRI